MYELEIHCWVELSKLTHVEVEIIISPLFLSISVIFLQKAMAKYIIFYPVLLYLLKVFPSLLTPARNQSNHLAIYGTFSRKSPEIIKNEDKTSIFLLLIVIFQLRMPRITSYDLRYCSESSLQEVFRVYLNKFENAVTNLFLVIFGNN